MMLQKSLIHFCDIQCYKFNISVFWIEFVVGIGFFWGKGGIFTCCCCTSGASFHGNTYRSFHRFQHPMKVQIRVQNFILLQGKLLSSVFNKSLPYKKPKKARLILMLPLLLLCQNYEYVISHICGNHLRLGNAPLYKKSQKNVWRHCSR